MTIFEKIIDVKFRPKSFGKTRTRLRFTTSTLRLSACPDRAEEKPFRVSADATDADAALLGKLLLVARDVAKELELSSGYRVVINCGPDAGESVPHLHVHLLGKRALAWPPG
jgi:hypothetical protein